MQKEFCSSCGAEVSPTDNYCMKCGAFVDGSEENGNTSPPAVTTMPKQALRDQSDYITRRHLPADALIFFFFSLLSRSVIIFILVLIGAVLQPNPFIIGLVLYFAALGVISLFIYNNFLYEIDQDGLRIESGVIHKHQVSLPYEQIQNVNVERSLLDRILNLARVSIETAGGTSATQPTESGIFRSKSEAYIPGLHIDQATKIHDLLMDGADGSVAD
jgi:membrane protein YdbS with pleckstrin-like domain